MNPLMNSLRFFKLAVMISVPFLGALYVYQFSNQSREIVKPFRPLKVKSRTVLQAGNSEIEAEIPLDSPVVIVNYWATWCPPCVEEFPSMLELQRVLAQDGLKLVFVSVDENWDDVTKFMAQHSITVPDGQLFWDPKREAALAWGSDKFPETYVVRSDGWIVEKIIGQQDWTRPAVLQYFRGLTSKFAGLTLGTRIN